MNGASVRLPSGAPSGRANATAIAASAAEQNHFSPLTRQTLGASPAFGGRAVVVDREMSDPPCASVIHWPLVIARAESVETSRGSQAARTSASTSSRDNRAAAPSLIATGHENTADSGP